MYITVFELNKNHETARKISNRHEMHRDVQKILGESRADCRNVYRIVERHGKILLYIRSEKPISKVDEHPEMKLLGKSEQPSLKNGQTIMIDMLVTPIKTMVGTDGKARKRPIFYTDKRIEWCKEKARQYGFEISEISEVKKEVLKINKHDGNKGWSVDAFEYKLKATITDEDMFNETLVNGFGRNGSYGAGMIFVA